MSELEQNIRDTYLDGSRDLALSLITVFEQHGQNKIAEFVREALFIVESERTPR